MTEGGRSGGRIGAAVRGMSLRARLLVVLGGAVGVGLSGGRRRDLRGAALVRSSTASTARSTAARRASRTRSRRGSAPVGPHLRAADPVPRAARRADARDVRRDPRPGGGRKSCQRHVHQRRGETAPPARAYRRASAPQADGGARRATVSADKGRHALPPARALHRRFAEATLILGVPLEGDGHDARPAQADRAARRRAP